MNIGAARISVINLGDLKFALKDFISLPQGLWKPRFGSLFEAKLAFPSQSVHISFGDSSILVDPGDYWKFAAEGREYVEDGYVPPSGLVEQLQGLGVKPEEISHVVITHAHLDHFAGATTSKSGRLIPTFPNARYFLGEDDWEMPEIRKSISDPKSNEAKTLGKLHKLGVLELVRHEKELVPGIRIIPTPGESPGHQVLRIRSNGETAYCVGDLFHHSVEVENPELMASWCDRPSNLRSRKAILRFALNEDAVVIPAHMLPGRINRVGRRMAYVTLAHPNS